MKRPTSASTQAPIADADGEQAATAVARSYVDAVIKKDKAAATALTCDKTDAGSLYNAIVDSGTKPQMGAVKMLSPNMAMVDITIAGSSAKGVPYAFELKKGAWCVPY